MCQNIRKETAVESDYQTKRETDKYKGGEEDGRAVVMGTAKITRTERQNEARRDESGAVEAAEERAGRMWKRE